MAQTPQTSLETRQRLLQAAGEVFADVGFRTATVRDICDRAGANVAAVNYHFQNKEHLYGAVLKFAQSCALEKYPPTLGLPEQATPRQRLFAFVRAFLLRIFDQGRPAWHGKLMAREMVEPTGALDELVSKFVRPQSQILHGIVRDVLGDQATDDLVRSCLASIVGQCLFYHHCRPVIERLFPEQRYEPQYIEHLAEHITAFSFAAMMHQESWASRDGAKIGERR